MNTLEKRALANRHEFSDRRFTQIYADFFKYLFVFISVHSWFSSSAVAHNNLFLPGDAFFSARFSKDFFEEQKDASILDLSYERYAGDCADCTWFAYENLSIRDVSPATLANLKKTHSLLFTLFPNEAKTNPFDKEESPWFPIYVYNADFPISYPVGLKFNESANAEQASTDKKVYDHFDDVDLITEDLASQNDVAPLTLDVSYDDLVTRLNGEIVREPVTTVAAKLQFLILPGASVREFALKKEGLCYFVVTAEKIARYRFDKKRTAHSEPLDAQLAKTSSQWTKAREDLRLLRAAIDIYKLNNGDELPPESDSAWIRQFFPKGMPKDPWGRAYDYNGIGVFLAP